MFTSGLFYVVFVSVLVLLFVGNRVTEGGGNFGRKPVVTVMSVLGRIVSVSPRTTLSFLLALVACIVAGVEFSVPDFLQVDANVLQIIALAIGYYCLTAVAIFVTTAVYCFLERLAEVFTYYWSKVWLIDITRKSRIVAFFAMILVAIGLLDSDKFSERLDYIGKHDRTMIWVRKIAAERRAWLKRRNENQEALRESRLKWDLYHQIKN